MKYVRRLLVLMLTVTAGAALTACESPGEKETPVLTGPAVTLDYKEVATLYNVRVQNMDRIWARSRLRIQFTDREGEKVDESAEGHLQIIRPRKLALTVTKVGETLYYLGSNDQLFWWLDIRKEKSGVVGRHADTTLEAVSAMGVPLLPLDVLELLGVLPLDVDAAGKAKAIGGRFEVMYPARGMRLAGIEDADGISTVRMVMDRKTLEPQTIEVRGSDGKIAVRAELKNYQPVIGVPGGSVRPRLATMFELFVPKSETRFTIKLLDTQNRGERMNPAAFDLEKLLAAYSISDVKLIEPAKADAQPESKAATPPKPSAPANAGSLGDAETPRPSAAQPLPLPGNSMPRSTPPARSVDGEDQ